MSKLWGGYNSKLMDCLNDYRKVLKRINFYLDATIEYSDDTYFENKSEIKEYLKISGRIGDLINEFKNEVNDIEMYEELLLKTEEETGISATQYQDFFDIFFAKYKRILIFLKKLYKEEYKIVAKNKKKNIDEVSMELVYHKLRIESIKRKIDDFDGLVSQIKIIKNIGPKALNGYDKNWSWYFKIEFCLKKQLRIMTLNELADSLIQFENDLVTKNEGRRDLITTLSSICIQNISPKRLERRKYDERLQNYYGLASWIDPTTGKFMDEYFPNS